MRLGGIALVLHQASEGQHQVGPAFHVDEDFDLLQGQFLPTRYLIELCQYEMVNTNSAAITVALVDQAKFVCLHEIELQFKRLVLRELHLWWHSLRQFLKQLAT